MSVVAAAPSAPVGASTAVALPRRLAALLIDIVVLSVLEAIVNAVFGVTHVTSGFAPAMTSGAVAVFTTQTVVDWPWLTLLLIVYYAVLEGLFGATAGKAVTGLRVTNLDGRIVSWQAALIRNGIRPLDAFPLAYLLGGILVLASRQHQRLGDRVAGTLVVPRSAVTSEALGAATVRWRGIALTAAVMVLLAVCGWFYYFGRPPLVIEGLKNTGQFFHPPVSSYRLGGGQFGNGSVTYPITYRYASTDQECEGSVTLRWNWPAGWEPAEAQTSCTPRIYP